MSDKLTSERYLGLDCGGLWSVIVERDERIAALELELAQKDSDYRSARAEIAQLRGLLATHPTSQTVKE